MTVEQVAQCLYLAWTTGDSELAAVYGSEEAIAWLGPPPDEPPGWEWLGCGESYGPVGEQACSWFVEDEFHGVQIQMIVEDTPSVHRIVSIESYG